MHNLISMGLFSQYEDYNRAPLGVLTLKNSFPESSSIVVPSSPSEILSLAASLPEFEGNYTQRHEEIRLMEALVQHGDKKRRIDVLVSYPSHGYVNKANVKPEGVLISGALGARGMFHHCLLSSDIVDEKKPVVATELYRKGFEALRSRGIHRVHAVVNNQDEIAHPILSDLGFLSPQGEKLLQRDIIVSDDAEFKPESYCGDIFKQGGKIRDGRFEDLDQLFDTIAKIPELAVANWEKDIITNEIQDPSSGFIFLVATLPSSPLSQEEKIVGLLLGGHAGIRGTFNHVWVDEQYRRHKFASGLVSEGMRRFRDDQVKRVHVMITPGNSTAERFWNRWSFHSNGEHFVERDL